MSEDARGLNIISRCWNALLEGLNFFAALLVVFLMLWITGDDVKLHLA